MSYGSIPGEPEALPDPSYTSEEWLALSAEEQKDVETARSEYYQRDWEIKEFRRKAHLHASNALEVAKLQERAHKLIAEPGLEFMTAPSGFMHAQVLLLLLDIQSAASDGAHASRSAASAAQDIFERQRDPNYKYR